MRKSFILLFILRYQNYGIEVEILDEDRFLSVVNFFIKDLKPYSIFFDLKLRRCLKPWEGR